MQRLNSKGIITLPFLTIIAIFCLLAYLFIANSFSFKNKLLNTFYYKKPSQAFESVQIPPQDNHPILTSAWTENWNSNLDLWTRSSFNCSSTLSNTLNLNCTNGSLITKDSWNSAASIIINGTFSLQDSGSLRIGLINPQTQSTSAIIINPQSPASESDYILNSYQTASTQKFRLVYTMIDQQQFIYFYLGDNPQPQKKVLFNENGNLNVFLSCQGQCTFGPLAVSGSLAN